MWSVHQGRCTVLGRPSSRREVDPGLDGGGEEEKGEASDPEPIWNEL